eukprot:228996-Hanusia_phi.AAC.3
MRGEGRESHRSSGKEWEQDRRVRDRAAHDSTGQLVTGWGGEEEGRNRMKMSVQDGAGDEIWIEQREQEAQRAGVRQMITCYQAEGWGRGRGLVKECQGEEGGKGEDEGEKADGQMEVHAQWDGCYGEGGSETGELQGETMAPSGEF